MNCLGGGGGGAAGAAAASPTALALTARLPLPLPLLLALPLPLPLGHALPCEPSPPMRRSCCSGHQGCAAQRTGAALLHLTRAMWHPLDSILLIIGQLSA